MRALIVIAQPDMNSFEQNIMLRTISRAFDVLEIKYDVLDLYTNGKVGPEAKPKNFKLRVNNASHVYIIANSAWLPLVDLFLEPYNFDGKHVEAMISHNRSKSIWRWLSAEIRLAQAAFGSSIKRLFKIKASHLWDVDELTKLEKTNYIKKIREEILNDFNED